MASRFDSYFSYASVKADGSLQVSYSTHDYSISKVPTRWQADAIVSNLAARDADTQWVVLTYPEAVEIGI